MLFNTKKIKRNGLFLSKKQGAIFSMRNKKLTKKKIVIWLVLILGVLIFISLICVKISYDKVTKLTQSMPAVQEALDKKDIKLLSENLDQIANDLQIARIAINTPVWFHAIPIIEKDYSITKNSINSASILINSLNDFTKEALVLASENEINDFGSLELGTMSKQTKSKVLKILSELDEEALKVSKAYAKSEKIIKKSENRKANINQVEDGKEQVAKYISEFKKLETGLVVLTGVLPEIAGYPEKQRFLFLFENNMELRAGGGFIAAIGSAETSNGAIKNLSVGDSYKIESILANYTEAPDWFKQYNAGTKWYIRDSSIASSDFPTVAKKTLDTYKLIKDKDPFDGVVAITPTLLENLISVTGDITLEDYPYLFTSENTAQIIQEHTQYRYKDLGISENERKDLLADLSAVVLAKVFSIKSDDLGKLLSQIQKSFAEKHIMIFLKNGEAESVLETLGWAGKVNTENDLNYFSQVDNNVAALKTDGAVERNSDLTISTDKETKRIRIRAVITYKNTARSFTPLYTRYRTYGWLLVPFGSEILSYQDADSGDKDEGNNNGEVKVFNEDSINKTRFEYFKSIEPSTKESIVIEYLLPKTIKYENLRTLIQKQPGVTDATTTVRFEELSDSITTNLENNDGTFTSQLNEDKYIYFD